MTLWKLFVSVSSFYVQIVQKRPYKKAKINSTNKGEQGNNSINKLIF